MKAIFGWVFDPYVDVVLIAIALVGFTTASGPEGPDAIRSARSGDCQYCQNNAAAAWGCRHLVASNSVVIR